MEKVLVFSPPRKPEEPRVEVAVLRLQPFSDAPQVSFEEVPVGREAVRQLRVLNPTSSEHVVRLCGPLGQRGFSADRETFAVPPSEERTVSFTWKPDGKDRSSRAVLTVTSDGGFRGRCVLLGTVKPPPAKPVLKPPKPSPAPKKLPVPKVLMALQRLNVMRTAPAAKKPCPRAAVPVKVTVPEESKTHSKEGPPPACGAPSSKDAGTAKVSCTEGPGTTATKETGPREEPENTKRATFDRDMATAAVAAGGSHEQPPEGLDDQAVDGD